MGLFKKIGEAVSSVFSGGNKRTNPTYSNGGTVYSSAQQASIIAPEVLKDAVKQKYSTLSGTVLGQFDISNYGLTYGQMGDAGQITGSDSLVYDNGTLLVRNDLINQFYSIFAAQNKSAVSKSTQFLAQDTVLSGASASKKGTVLGGIV